MMSTARHRLREPRSAKTARIVIIDHDPVFRVGLAQALRCSKHLRIVAHAANLAVGLVLVCDGSVDIVVLGLDAISTCHEPCLPPLRPCRQPWSSRAPT